MVEIGATGSQARWQEMSIGHGERVGGPISHTVKIVGGAILDAKSPYLMTGKNVRNNPMHAVVVQGQPHEMICIARS